MFDDVPGGGGNTRQTPVYTSNVGSMCVSVWERRGDYGPLHSIKIQRMYNDKKSNELKYGDSFQPGDLGAVMMLVMEFASWRVRRMDAWRKWKAGHGGGAAQSQGTNNNVQNTLPPEHGGPKNGGATQTAPEDIPF